MSQNKEIEVFQMDELVETLQGQFHDGTVVDHLADISISLQILSGRMTVEEMRERYRMKV